MLIGYRLENDLWVLKLVHDVVWDTSIVLPIHMDAKTRKRKLKDLAKTTGERDPVR